ncbi:Ubiquitin-conjugating enzyme E2 15 [Botrytis cinerea]
MGSAAANLLGRQLKEIQKAKDLPGISCGLVKDNIFEWDVMLMLSDECKYYGGGNWRCLLSFPENYPHAPPTLTFCDPIPFHPNIYADTGVLCISILHPSGTDDFGYEDASERWTPIQTPETILLSVVSLMNDPNDSSPANVDAAKMWREAQANPKGKEMREWKSRCRALVRQSLGINAECFLPF